MTKLIPFADDSASMTIGQLTIENGTDRIAVYGSLDVTCDRKGLADAHALKVFVDQVVQALEARPDLPSALAGGPAPKIISNPFQ